MTLLSPLLLNAYQESMEQWNNIQKLLQLSPDNVLKIKEKVGPINHAQLQSLLSAIKKLSMRTVSPSNLLPNDALNVARNWHELLAENEYVRILWTTLSVGQKTNPHTHQWPTIIFTVSQETIGITKTSDGKEIKEPWSQIVEEVEGFTSPSEFYNCGPNYFCALEIELKKSIPN